MQQRGRLGYLGGCRVARLRRLGLLPGEGCLGEPKFDDRHLASQTGALVVKQLASLAVPAISAKMVVMKSTLSQAHTGVTFGRRRTSAVGHFSP